MCKMMSRLTDKIGRRESEEEKSSYNPISIRQSDGAREVALTGNREITVTSTQNKKWVVESICIRECLKILYVRCSKVSGSPAHSCRYISPSCRSVHIAFTFPIFTSLIALLTEFFCALLLG